MNKFNFECLLIYNFATFRIYGRVATTSVWVMIRKIINCGDLDAFQGVLFNVDD